MTRDTPPDPTHSERFAGRFLVGARLARGATATVFDALDAETGEPVALKVFDVPDDDDADDARGLWTRERDVLGALRHPHVVRLVSAGAGADGRLYLALERVRGPTLKALLARGEVLAPPRAVEVASQLTSALGALHALGFVHRDVGPANVMLSSDRDDAEVRLIDLGLAQPLRAFDDAPESPPGLVHGGHRTMSPEQALGASLDGRADLYSVGALLFELLTGAPPFPRPSARETLHAHVHEAPPALRSPDPDAPTPPALCALVARLLEKDRTRRFDDAEALTAALRACSTPAKSHHERPALRGPRSAP